MPVVPESEGRAEAAKSGRMADGKAVVKTMHIGSSLYNNEKLYFDVEFKIKSFTDTEGKERDEYRGRTVNHRFWVGTNDDPMADGRGGKDKELLVATWTKGVGGKEYFRYLEAAQVPATGDTDEHFDYINGNQPELVISLKTKAKRVRQDDGTYVDDPSGKTFQNVNSFYKLRDGEGDAKPTAAVNGNGAVKRVVPRMELDDEDEE